MNDKENPCIQDEIDRILADEANLLEAVKNTILNMLNTDPSYHKDMAEFCVQALDNYCQALVDENSVLRERLSEIREVWAGSECGEPVHAQEAYAIRLCKQQYQIACDALNEDK